MQFIKFQIHASEYNLNINYIETTDYDNYHDIKNKLNLAKNLLDNIPENQYLYVSYLFDAFRSLKRTIAKTYNMQTVSNATLKIYEIITQMNLINNKKISVFFNAELPGNFIVGLNHYLKTKYKKNSVLNWVASSYLSDTGTLGDTYGILNNNKDKWLMDHNMNGDMTQIDNVIELSKRVLDRFPKGVDIYTSDAGLDVSSNYNEQEEQTLILNYGQILCGLLTIKKGGTLITKQFTYFTNLNSSLIILLSNLFEEFYITKPATSKPLNSEIYLIGIGYKGITHDLKQFLIEKMPILNPNIPIVLYKFNDKLLESANYIYHHQINYINKAYEYYNNKTKTPPLPINEIQKEWLNSNPITSIEKRDYIPFN